METPAASTGTATPLELDPEQAAQSLKVSLADLCAKATALYVHKNYEDAAEIFARAAEMQAEMNGEMNPENAEILFLYGRALFRVGQSKSDVLGGKAPETKKSKPKASNGSSKKNGVEKAEAKVEKAASSAAAETVAKKEGSAGPEGKKPLFHFEGDENFVDSEEEEEVEEGEEEEGEEDDDLATAFEILDLARVLLEKKLESAQEEDEAQKGKGKEADSGEDSSPSPKVRHIKERLADTHDLLAEISLENERYPNAITDSRASLKFKQELYPFESEIIAEAHFKLSLALEFASVTKPSEDDSAPSKETSEVDQSLRDEAAAELAKAIESTKLKLQAQEVELAAVHNPEDNDLSRQEIGNIKEILAEMEQRLVELRKPPLDINQALGLPSRGEEVLAKPVSEEVTKNANDLSGLVRKKRKAEDEVPKEDTKRAKSQDPTTTAATEVAAATENNTN